MKATQPSPPTHKVLRHLGLFDDPIHDPYHPHLKLSEPAVCSECGAVFHEGRWQWIAPTAHAQRTRCAACRRIDEKQPAGYVSIEGQFANEHRAELLSIARNLEAREKAEHPLQRIMAIDEQDDKVTITTTDIHLARGIGEALERAYKGELNFHYNKDEYRLRVQWQR